MKKRYTPARYSLATSFGWALSGVMHALRHERNLRIDFALAAYALYFSRYYSLDAARYGLLILTIGFVIVCEMFNTAIENTVDLETSSFHSLAKVAKDVAAGAVLVSAAVSVAVGVLLFWNKEILRQIGRDIAARPIGWILPAALTALWIAWPRRRK